MAVTKPLRALNPWLISCLAAGCIAIGLLAGGNPEYGLLAAGGVMFAAVVIMDLTLGFVMFTALSFLDLLSSSGSFSGTKVIGLLLFASWLARMAAPRAGQRASFVAENPWLVVALLALVGWAALSFSWAHDPSTALGGAGRYGLDMMLIPIAFAALRERKHVVWVVAAFVIAAVLSCAYGFVNPPAQTTAFAGRLTGSFGDPNAEATVLAAAIALLVGLIGVIRHSARLKLASLVGLGIMFVGLVTTLSREGLLALAAVLIGAVIFGGRWRRRATTLLVIGVAATAGYYFVLAPLAARQRVTMADTSGRTSIWTIAWRVFEAHPVLGVGTDNFILVEGRYINQPGAVAASYIITAPRVAHDAYLEALVDLGVPGLLTLLAVIGCCIGAAVRAAWIFERLRDVEMELISRGVVLALAAVLTGDVFVSSEYAKYLWIPLALCPVLLALARRAAAQSDVPRPAPAQSDVPRSAPAQSAVPRSAPTRRLVAGG